MKPLGIFVSGVQKELAEERAAVSDYIRSDPLLSRYFGIFLFEDIPAQDRRPDELYLGEVDTCSIYLGIYANEYGSEDSQGISPTEREFDQATDRGKYRLIFIKDDDDSKRHPKMQNLISRATPHVVRRRFAGVDNLKKELFASLVQYLCDKKILSFTPFDESVCSGATLSDISDEKIAWFVSLARKERKFPLPVGTPTEKVLTHLDLLSENHPTIAAILLFGIKPERFFPNAETKCMHYHGTVMAKPIPSYQVFAGTLFDQADNATDFVLSKINRIVPPRDVTPTSETRYEIPKEVIQEAIVNAIAHRDYSSDAGVQVSVFSDRIEIRNPGNLPPDLTFEDLKVKHNSRPRNHRIALPLFLTHYIEAIGYGTLQMIDGCKEAGLPEPEFAQSSGEFVVILWRDWLTEKYLVRLNLNERQMKVIGDLKTKRKISNIEYRDLTAATPKTAGRDLEDLVEKGILELKGKGRGAYYVLAKTTKSQPDEPTEKPDHKQDK